MRVLIANDKFKGSLTAEAAAEAIAAGLPSDWELDICPIADGGEGFTSTLLAALGGERIQVDTVDALLRPITASFILTADRLAVMEMASANGLEQIAAADRDLLNSSTYGTGLLLQAASEAGAQRILIGIGGSATNDGGVGMLAALGACFMDANEEPLNPTPAGLKTLAEVDAGGLLTLPPVHVACDVTNPLLGPQGATEVFGPQKGAGPAERKTLEEFLTRLVEVTGAHAKAQTPGVGAAGGLGFGLHHFLQAELASGFDLVAEATGLGSRIEEADLVITGEGSLDSQSLSGKGPVGVARLAADLSTPCFAYAGHLTPEVAESGLFARSASLSATGLPLDTLLREAAPLLTDLVRDHVSRHFRTP